MPNKSELDWFERAIVMTAIWAPSAVSEFIANQDMPFFQRFWTAGSALNLLLGLAAIGLLNWHRQKKSESSYPTALAPSLGKKLTGDASAGRSLGA